MSRDFRVANQTTQMMKLM